MGGPIYSEEQRERFFEILDRGGTVRAAARSAGVSEHAAYRWVSTSGLAMFRATPRKYTSEERADFFQRLAVNPNVSVVAKEMGIPRVTCYAWAHRAGIFTSEARKTNPRREEFLRLRAEGLTRAEARKQVGADARSATDWDKGITIINRGRVYPDGRVVRYPEPIMSGVPERRTRAIGGSVDLNKVEQIIDSRYLGLLERAIDQADRGGDGTLPVHHQPRAATQHHLARLHASHRSPDVGRTPCTPAAGQAGG